MGFDKYTICADAVEKKNFNNFDYDCDAIKGYLCDIGNSYLLIAYRVWEINISKSYEKAGYKNIVEAMSERLGFKKSTIYNFLNICKTFGRDKNGVVNYQSLINYNRFNYSQLCEMLSMTSNKIALVSPDMSVSEIREIKKTEKFQTSGKEVSVNNEFQTSGKSANTNNDLYKWSTFSPIKKINFLVSFIHSHGLL